MNIECFYPGGPMAMSFVLLLGFVITLVATLFLVTGIRWLKKGKIKKNVGIVFTVFGLLLTALIVLYFIGGKYLKNQSGKRYVGHYYEERLQVHLYLNEDNSWESNYDMFKCASGTWVYEVNDEFRYLELTCKYELKGFTEINALDTISDTLTFYVSSGAHQGDLILMKRMPDNK